MRTLLVFIAYNGARYHGYQVQKNTTTVAETFQNALEKVLGHRPDIKGCSRTDAGVHANEFAISFATDRGIPCDGLVRAMNVQLPPDIALLSCQERAEGFHARYASTGKRYVYKVRNSQVKNPFGYRQELLYKYPLDAPALNTAAQAFLGTHDFKGFCSAGSSVQDTVRTIYDFTVTREGDMVYFSVTGDGFLYNMVRILVGTLLEVAAGKLQADQLPSVLASGQRTAAGATVPPWGLYLDKVFYQPIPKGEGFPQQEEVAR